MSGPARQNARRIRADLLLVSRGVFESRSRARAAIEAGLVVAAGDVVRRPSDLLAPDVGIVAEQPHPWVSRGGVKLAVALDAFGIDPRGLDCLDIGASTGGFTDVLLSRGAASVLCVDVGRGQLHARLAADPRVTSHEGRDARDLDGIVPAASVDLMGIDVSFISVRLVLPGLVRLMKAQAQVIVLVKPQFEVGRAGIARGGIVQDETLRAASVGSVAALMSDLGMVVRGPVESPITGRDGNREYLLGGRVG